MRYVFLGPPGAGKGTVGREVAARHHIPQIATGDLLRAEVEKGTELGTLVHGYMECGELVPDNIILHLLQNRLDEEDAQQGFILDGFPRTVAQAQALLELLTARKQQLDGVAYLDVDDEAVINRLSGRRVCGRCGAIYHVRTHPPQEEGRCDQCKEQLILRDDDQPETVQRRLHVYHQQTEPLIQFFQERGMLRRVAAGQAPAAVLQAVEGVIERALRGGRG